MKVSQSPLVFFLHCSRKKLLGIRYTGFVLPVTQQTVLKHWLQSDKNHPLVSFFLVPLPDSWGKGHCSLYASSLTTVLSVSFTDAVKSSSHVALIEIWFNFWFNLTRSHLHLVHACAIGCYQYSTKYSSLHVTLNYTAQHNLKKFKLCKSKLHRDVWATTTNFFESVHVRTLSINEYFMVVIICNIFIMVFHALSHKGPFFHSKLISNLR